MVERSCQPLYALQRLAQVGGIFGAQGIPHQVVPEAGSPTLSVFRENNATMIE